MRREGKEERVEEKEERGKGVKSHPNTIFQRLRRRKTERKGREGINKELWKKKRFAKP